MAKEEKRSGDDQYSLEELNQQFIKKIKKKKKYKEIPGIWMLALIALVILIVVLTIWKVTGTQSTGEGTKNETAAAGNAVDEETEMYNESILSEEEQEKWASTDMDGEKIYVVLNTKVYLDGDKAYIRLINPIYSTYYYNITIYPEGQEDTILYQSEKIAPGTILEAVKLSAEPTEEQYHAVVKYQVYNEEGKDLGTHLVNVEFNKTEVIK